jgi:CDP-paratose 2-epimerase
MATLPNDKPLRELTTRYDYAEPEDFEGIDENCRIDRTVHSIFGASKVAADVMSQEYGRYFGMKVGIFAAAASPDPAIQVSSYMDFSPIWSR